MPVVLTDKTMRPRDKHDNYPTPKGLVKAIFRDIRFLVDPKTILDPGAGSGVFGEVAREFWPDSSICGIEIRDITEPYDKGIYDQWSIINYIDEPNFYSDNSFDLIIGNPPYRYAEEFVRKSRDLLTEKGLLIFLLRLDFLSSIKRGKGLWKEYRPFKINVCSRRPSFTGDKKTYADNYCVVYWDKFSNVQTFLDWLMWDYE